MSKIENLKSYLLESKIKNNISNAYIHHGEFILESNIDNIYELIKFLRDDKKCLFKVLVSICGVDYPQKEKRFEIVYNLLSLELNQRIRCKIFVSENEFIPSITKLFSNAGWYERETYDLFGVFFAGNDDLRRILTDYGFEGHPMRKDFPLTGKVEVRYDLEKKKVVYEDVKLSQEFRNFDFMSPWEGANYILPGDEKATKE